MQQIDSQMAYHPPQIPAAIGLTGSFQVYGRDKKNTVYAWVDDGGYLNRENEIDMSTTNSIVMCHIFLRLQSKSGRFRPYIDGLAGFSWFKTYAHLYDHLYGEAYRTSFQLDRTFTCGMGCGVQYRVKSGAVFYFRDILYVTDIYLDAGMRIFDGGMSYYMRKGDDTVFKSETDIFTIRAGLTFVL